MTHGAESRRAFFKTRAYAVSDLLWPGDDRAGDLFSHATVLAAMVRVEAAWLDSLVLHGVAGPDARDDLTGLAGPADVAAVARDAESGGNPHAINTWDSNALRGTPSRGLMQTIPSTFHAYVHPEMRGRSITDPVANITAGVRYMIDRYGAETVARGGRTDGAGGYLGY